MSRIPITNDPYHGKVRDTSTSFRISSRLKEDIEKISVMNRTSVTDILNEVLIKYAVEHMQEIRYYNNVFDNAESPAGKEV